MSEAQTIATIEKLVAEYWRCARGNKRKKLLRRVFAYAIEQMPEWQA